MTVKELKQQLEKLDDNIEILMYSDEEGNEFNSLYHVNIEKCIEWKHEYEVIDEEDFEELDEEDKLKTKDCLILWP